jgi:hypothetical protein
MRYWQVTMQFAGFVSRTTEFVRAESYAAALAEFDAAQAAGGSGFPSGGCFNVVPVNGMPSHVRGVPTRLATSRPYVGK